MNSNKDERTRREHAIKLVSAQFSTKLGDALASPKIILPWLMTLANVPAFLIGLIVPIREAGSMLPQILLRHPVKNTRYRKHVMLLGCSLQAITVGLMGLALWQLEGLLAGVVVIVLMLLFSLARSLCSIASKDLLGKLIPKGQRGRLGGWSASLAGLVTLLLGLALANDILFKDESLVWLLCVAALTWFAAAMLFFSLKEPSPRVSTDSEDPEQDRNSVAFQLLTQDANFRRFVIARCLMLSSALSAPYFVLLAQRSNTAGYADQPIEGPGIFIFAAGLAGLLSGYLWGRFADSNSKGLLVANSLVMASLCAVTAWCAYGEFIEVSWVYALLFFAASVLHEGIRLGRKTYIVDIAEGGQRTDYVAISNSIVGGVLLVIGLGSAAIAQLSLPSVFIGFALLSAAGGLVALSTQDA